MPKSKIKFQCTICGKITGGRLPKMGDGTFYFPRRHKNNSGKFCEGNYIEAIFVENQLKVGRVKRTVKGL